MKQSTIGLCVIAVIVAMWSCVHRSRKDHSSEFRLESADANELGIGSRVDVADGAGFESGIADTANASLDNVTLQTGVPSQRANAIDRARVFPVTGTQPTEPLGLSLEPDELPGSQTEPRPTPAGTLPPEHLAALIAASAEAEIVEEVEKFQTNSFAPSTAAEIDHLTRLQERVSAASDADRSQVGRDLVAAFGNKASDDAKIDLIAMAAELKETPYSRLLLQLGLASTENEEVRVQAIFVAADLCPDLLLAFVNDANEAVRDEVETQLNAQ